MPAITIDCTPAAPETPDICVTGDLLEALKAYRRDWDEEKMIFSEQPVHDWSSDFADAFGYMCVVANPNAMPRTSSDMDSQIIVSEGTGYNLETLHGDYMRRNQEVTQRIQ